MSGYINVVSRTQHIIVDPGSSAIAVINAGPPRSGDSGGSGGSDGIVIMLPPPLTSGSPFQSFTDNSGDVWVAKGDVNGGSWKRARDVLHGHWYRTIAWTIPTVKTIFGHNLKDIDDYDVYNGGTGFLTALVGGIYRVDNSIAGGSTASGIWVQALLYKETTILSYGLSHSASTVWVMATASWVGRLNAGEKIATYEAASVAQVGQVAPGTTQMSFSYLGAG